MQCRRLRRLRRLLPSVARDHVRGVAARKVQRGERERDAIFTLVQNTRRPNIRVLRSLLHCAKRDRALRRKIGHGRETEEGRLALGSFLPSRMVIFTPTTSQIKGKQLREIINRSVTKGMSR